MIRAVENCVMRLASTILACLLCLTWRTAGAAVSTDGTVSAYHGDPARSGNYVIPTLSWQTLRTMHRDKGFDGRVSGHVYAQPLYWRPPGAAHGLILVVTESDVVAALDAVNGRAAWSVTLGRAVPLSALPCGNIDPLGITGTPVIDPAAGAIYLDAVVEQNGAMQHLVFGLRLRDGAVLPGWPVNVEAALRTFGVNFIPRQQNQRGALAFLDGRIFVGYGGNYGDCGSYHGIVLGIDAVPPRAVAAWATRGLKGGIWTPGGITVADGSLFFTTGNAEVGNRWEDGEGVFRLRPSLARNSDPEGYFAPANWKQLDDEDLDMTGSPAMPIDVTSPGGVVHRVVVFGKDGNAYLLNRDDLGGIGGQIAIRTAGSVPIITSPAVYSTRGRTWIVYQARDATCPNGDGGAGLAALRVTAADLVPLWCTPFDGRGEPIVTTTDGAADPIVWAVSAGAGDRLHAMRGDNGTPLWTSRERIPGLRPFATILAAGERLYVAGDGGITAFTWAAR
jgi:outer membrane protein assembly factor BamB